MQPKQPKKRVVTSCLECYRRKQKCNRLRPCSFCSARGVPELCRYDIKSERSAESIPPAQHENTVPPHSIANDGHVAKYAPPPSFSDQVGYSMVSRRGELERIGEYSSVNTSSGSGDRVIAIRKADTYRSLVSRLPSEKVICELVDIHFSTENWSFPVLDEHHFRKLHREFQSHIVTKPSMDNTMHLPAILATFPALIFAVMAVALQFTSPDARQTQSLDSCNAIQYDTKSEQYIENGQDIVDFFRNQKPTTSSIEYHIVKMAWLKNCGRSDESWQSLGVALRQAQEIDLHQVREVTTQDPTVEVGQTLLRFWEFEHQKRLWARIFIMDSHMAIALGRPRGINREDCSTSAPLDCEYPREPSKTIPMSTKHGHEPPNSFSPVIFSIALGNKYHDLMSMRASKLDLTDFSRIQELHNSVQSMLTDLPPTLRPLFPDTSWDGQLPQLPAVRLRLLTTTNIFLLALHRPYIVTHVISRDAAIEAALTIMQAQQNLFTIVPQAQHKLFGYSFYTIDAGIFLTAAVLRLPPYNTEIADVVLQELQHASVRLGYMKGKSTVAGAGEVVLRRCCTLINSHVPSAASTRGYDFIESRPQAMDLATSSFLQRFGPLVSDQPTQDLISLLAEPSSSAAASISAASLESGLFHPENGLPVFDTPVDNDLSLSEFMAQNPVHWPT